MKETFFNALPCQAACLRLLSNLGGMEDALASSLGRLASLASALGSNPSDGQLEQLSSACSAALTNAQGQPPGPAQQRQLWEAAAGLWVSLSSRQSTLTTLGNCKQAACRPAELQHRSWERGQ